jgi:hypothetical protein
LFRCNEECRALHESAKKNGHGTGDEKHEKKQKDFSVFSVLFRAFRG